MITDTDFAKIIRHNPLIYVERLKAAETMLKELEIAGVPDAAYGIQPPRTTIPRKQEDDPRTVHFS